MMLPAGSLFSRLARNSRLALFVDHETKPFLVRSSTDFRLCDGYGYIPIVHRCRGNGYEEPRR